MAEVRVKIEDHLSIRLKRAFPAILKRAQAMVEAEGLRLAGRVQEHIKAKGIYDTGNLRKSVHAVNTSGPSWVSTTVAANANYAAAVHGGRKAEKTPPPVDVLVEWVKRRVRQGRIALEANKAENKGKRRRKGAKRSRREQEIRGIAFAIQEKIRKHGIKGRPFFDEVVVPQEAGIRRRLTERLRTAVRQEVKGGID